ncbi:OmpH family outer membrane protein [Gluconacetobacter tumulisoli]|uniref:OmpH family outer membrane protein n=1 Tax=Gluconacetobacter tumulisoli TaxID=1286189 RepID=A0A7W4PLI2_9PROT|nr:OmpH family outer membrane protein [Gluconacetobacter tumulisoli]MBB2202537.1 OmpH family outer membrane protein [Gluconacetobacter tumulisoli]
MTEAFSAEDGRTGTRPARRWILAGLVAVSGIAPAMAAPAPRAAATAAAPAAAPAPAPAAEAGPDGAPAEPVLPAPIVPTFGTLPAGVRPPQPVIGVFDTGEIMRQSVAVQQVEQEMGARREKLIQEVRAEETQIQALRQRMLNAPREQAEIQQRALQQRVASDQRKFGERNRILQEDIQVAMNQVQREVAQVVNTIGKSRGLTMVVQSGLTVLHGPEVDISQQVATRLNAILPHVYLPAENEDPEVIAKSGRFPTAPVQMTEPGPQDQQG